MATGYKLATFEEKSSRLQPPHLLRNVGEVTQRENNTSYSSISSKKRWFTFITENTPEVQVSSVKFVPANLSIFKAAKAVLTYIETTALKAKARKASMCAQSCTHTQTLIHYQAGHHESCRKLALFEFPVHPCDRSPLFLETEDRVHTHTHTNTHPPPVHTPRLSSVLLLLSTPCPHPSDSSRSFLFPSPSLQLLLSLWQSTESRSGRGCKRTLLPFIFISISPSPSPHLLLHV